MMPTYYHLFNTVDPGLIQHMGNGCNGHNEAEAEAAPWTVADSLALLTLMVVPVAAAPILCVGVVPLIPVSGPISAISVQGLGVPVITATTKAALAWCAVAFTASVHHFKRR